MFYQFKHMYEFIKFDVSAWLEGKKFKVVGVRNWVDRSSGAKLGDAVVDLVCIEDKCPNYRLKNGETFSAEYEKISIKTVKFGLHSGDIVIPVGMRAVLYVNDNNVQCVSFSCDEMKIVK